MVERKKIIFVQIRLARTSELLKKVFGFADKHKIKKKHVKKATTRPVTGYSILDLSRLLPGPLATQLLADLGAEVIK